VGFSGRGILFRYVKTTIKKDKTKEKSNQLSVTKARCFLIRD
jgi:hypothetical protein